MKLKISPFAKDALERIAATFIVAALGAVTAALVTYLTTGAMDPKATAMTALAAGLTAAWDVVKVFLAKVVGSPDSASFIK